MSTLRRNSNPYRKYRAHWFLIAIAVLAWTQSVAARAADSYTVPFTLHGHHIYVNASINESPVKLVLDSGAGGNVVTPKCAAKLGLKASGSGEAVGAGAKATPIQTVTLDSVAVGDTKAANQMAYIIPLPDALECDGLLGTPFFKQWALTIDYDNLTLTLTPQGKFMPPSDAVMFQTTTESQTVHIEATVDGKKGLFKIDTGANDTLTLFGPFVDKNGLRGKYSPAIKMVTGRGVGGLIYGDAVRIPGLVIGPFEFKDVSATLSRQTSGVFADARVAGNIGEEILERFKITFDETNQKVYLSKGAQFDRPFIGNRSGLATDVVKGAVYVRSVIERSPASDAGIREGDVIVAVDDKPTDSLKPWETRDLLYGPAGSTIKLTVRTGTDAPRDVTIKLRDLY